MPVGRAKASSGDLCIRTEEIMKKVLIAAAVFLCLSLSAYAFAQTSNATVGGTVSDSTGALIPGVTITAANTPDPAYLNLRVAAKAGTGISFFAAFSRGDA